MVTPAQIIINYTPATLADFKAALEALNGKPAEIHVAQPEGEFPESDDPMLAEVLKMVVDRGEVSPTEVERKLAIGYRRAMHLLSTIKTGCNFDDFLAGMWLDKLNGGR